MAMEPDNDDTIITDAIEAAHIIPFALADVGDGAQDTISALSQTWSCLYRLFPFLRARCNFSSDQINSPRNAMMLAAGIHDAFGKFKVSLKPTGEADTYKIKRYKGFRRIYNQYIKSDIIKLVSNDPWVPLPDPDLLAIHASIAEVLHMSGQSEVIDDFLNKIDLIGCLAADGSSDLSGFLATKVFMTR